MVRRTTLGLVAARGLDAEAADALECLRRAGTAVERVSERDLSPGEVQEAVLAGSADLGLVGSPAAPSDVQPAAVLARARAHDVMLGGRDTAATLAGLARGDRVGLTGLRRLGLLRAHRPDLCAVPSTNGHTPLSALESGEVDAWVLGAAESHRLGLAERITEFLDPRSWVPSPGQGAVLVLTRTGDEVARVAASGLDHLPSHRTWTCEIALARALGAGPDGPLGAVAMAFGRWIRVWGMAASPDGSRVVRADLTGSIDAPVDLGEALAELLSKRDAGEILQERDS